MGNALDAFRAQREAVDQLHARIAEVSVLLGQVRREADAITGSEPLRTLLKEELRWLEQTRQAVLEVRAWREQEARRFWPGVVRRWTVAGLFALASAATAGSAYAWATRPYIAELEILRLRMDFANAVEHRLLTMTAAERRQFEALMKWNTPFGR